MLHEAVSPQPAHKVSTSSEPIEVPHDRACIQCSYNLRGLPFSGQCPECGMPVFRSLQGYLLQFAAPQYLSNLRRGLSFILNGTLAWFVLLVAPFAIDLVGSNQLAAHIVRGLGLLATLAILYGIWLYTHPDPQFAGQDRDATARKVARAGAVAQCICVVFSGLDQLLNFPLGSVLLFLQIAALLVTFLGIILYTRWLAYRIPDPKMVERCTAYTYVLPLLVFPGCVFLMIGPIIALTLYWLLLDRLRNHLVLIKLRGQNPSPILS